ncbi:MAG: hypothetical protein P8H59_05665 [Flavobacteriales bacterium]|nr:hypothetical protein [Flavobacteriales bacterium]MDG1780414.1 hypothetical protein [Flavobacteriales bacterium]
MKNRLLIFLKKYRVPLIILVLGFLASYLAWNSNTEYEMPSKLRLMNYLGLTFFFTGVFLFMVKAKKVFLGNIALLAVLVILTELVCFFLLGMPSAVNKKFVGPDLPEDHIAIQIGYTPWADTIYHKEKTVDGKLIFSSDATIDSRSLRITPGKHEDRNQHALFFGCSICFGEGLADDETLAYQFQEQSDSHNGYNFAFSSYGANHMLARMQYEPLSNIVTEKEGVAFYIFFWDHLYRTLGSMERYTDFAMTGPYFTMEDDQLVRRKSFRDGRYAISKFYELVYQTNIVKKFKIGIPLGLNEGHYDLFTEIVLEAKKNYQNEFGGQPFYFVNYPSYKAYEDEQMEQLKAALTSKGIDVIDFDEFLTYGPQYSFGPEDAHPNAGTHEILSEELLKRIQQP